MRDAHKWSVEKSKKVTQLYGLRKQYEWKGFKPIRRKAGSEKKKVGRSVRSDRHLRKCCPIPGCLTNTIKITAHLRGHHKMKFGPEYYNLLKCARTYNPNTNDGVRVNDTRGKIGIALSQQEDDVVAELGQVQEDAVDDQSDSEIEEGQTDQPDNQEGILSRFLDHLMSLDGGKRERKSSLQTVHEVRTVVKNS